MLNEIKEILHNIKERRPIKETVKIYGNYTIGEKEAIYNDDEQCYVTGYDLKTCEKVSTVNSFMDFIKEELKRRKNETGSFATAVISSTGGRFTADDDLQKGNCEFYRSLSEQWTKFKNCIGKTYDHESFLRLLQELSPSIQNFHDVYYSLLDIRVVGRSESISKPFFVNGETETGYKINFKMRGGEDESITLPESIMLQLPYAKGNYEKLYEVEMNLIYDNRCGLNILIQAPTFEAVEEKALLDEVRTLKDNLKQYKDLLVLFNF